MVRNGYWLSMRSLTFVPFSADHAEFHWRELHHHRDGAHQQSAHRRRRGVLRRRREGAARRPQRRLITYAHISRRLSFCDIVAFVRVRLAIRYRFVLFLLLHLRRVIHAVLINKAGPLPRAPPETFAQSCATCLPTEARPEPEKSLRELINSVTR